MFLSSLVLFTEFPCSLPLSLTHPHQEQLLRHSPESTSFVFSGFSGAQESAGVTSGHFAEVPHTHFPPPGFDGGLAFVRDELG